MCARVSDKERERDRERQRGHMQQIMTSNKSIQGQLCLFNISYEYKRIQDSFIKKQKSLE